MTLLEKARKITDRKKVATGTPEQLERAELALAFLHGEVSIKQAAAASGLGACHIQSYMRNAIATGIRNGWIEAKFVGDRKMKVA